MSVTVELRNPSDADRAASVCLRFGPVKQSHRVLDAQTSDAAGVRDALRTEGIPADVSMMEHTMDAVDLARTTRCPYCTTTVALEQRTLGQHRAHSGVCSGSGRRVAEFDSVGRAVLESQTFSSDANVTDRNGQPIRRGDKVRDVKSGDTGEVWAIPNEVQVYYGPSANNYSHPGNLVKI